MELGNEFNVTPLMCAAKEDRAAIVQLLLAGGANVNSRTTDGRTALSIARIHKRDEIEKLLAQAGGKEIAPAKPTVIPWPAVDESGATIDYTTPESVLRSFIFAMNRWETDADKLRKSKKPHTTIVKESLAAMDAVLQFCTVKKRPWTIGFLSDTARI